MMVMAGLILFSCNNDNEADSPYTRGKDKTTVLIYAVATNSLSGNLDPDKAEMLVGAESIDMNTNNILVYQTTYRDTPKLLEIVETPEGYTFETIKEYSKEISSLDPERISEVLNFVTENFQSDNYGLIFWSHSSGSEPFIPNPEPETARPDGSFGQDIDQETSISTRINIDQLASLIPNGVFDYIWFDSCYMGNIESIYEFRGKCHYYIGYPTEVLDMGMPYHLVLPEITGSAPDVVKGAKAFFNYYYDYPSAYLRVATVGVVDMNKLDLLADVCKKAYSYTGYISPYSLACYTRGSTGPFFDLGDYVKAMAGNLEIDDFIEEWEDALNQCVIYKAATPTDFAGNQINQENYSGLSCHIYDSQENSLKENYYRSLSWFKDMRPNE